ncbi:MAG: hypothetical protein K8S22_06245 [Betaproteobacteria bacterium]|nr:hypothetical protein [Betaproteobacteria bacterium]
MMLTHVVFKISGAPDVLAAFDARLKLLFAEHGIADECEEQHTAGALHYDLKVHGGIPFPPFAMASSDFPELTVVTEWIDAGSGVRGTATIARGALAEQKVENLAASGAGHAVAIKIDAGGFLKLALAVMRTGRDECRGYMLTGSEDALFRITRDAATGAIELWATQGAAEWSRLWHISGDGATEYREIDPVQAIADSDFRELEKVAQDFVAQWIWFGNGPREEIAIEAARYERLGYAVSDANLRSAALHRIKGSAGNGGDGVRYSTLDAEIAWVEVAIARCWPRA